MPRNPQLNEIFLEFAKLVQNANIGNCSHASKKIVRDTNRLAIRSANELNDPALICQRSEEMASLIAGIRSIESGSPDEIRIKRECMEILVEMKKISSGQLPNQALIVNADEAGRKIA